MARLNPKRRIAKLAKSARNQEISRKVAANNSPERKQSLGVEMQYHNSRAYGMQDTAMLGATSSVAWLNVRRVKSGGLPKRFGGV